MTAPRTLLQLAGADLNPAKVRDAALVLIDFQNEYLADPIAVSPAKPPIVSAAKLLAGARRDGAPVFHIAHRGGGPGVDVVYDAVGQSTFEGSLRSPHRRDSRVLRPSERADPAVRDPPAHRSRLALRHPPLPHALHRDTG
jgi:hypothetical protein